MSFIQRTGTGSCFAQQWHTTDFNLSDRWSNQSQTWLDTDYHTNGKSFTGKGYIWAIFSDAQSLQIVSMYICYSETGDRHFAGSSIAKVNSMRVNSDLTTMQYGNDTAFSYLNNAYTSLIFNDKSRVCIIRLEA